MSNGSDTCVFACAYRQLVTKYQIPNIGVWHNPYIQPPLYTRWPCPQTDFLSATLPRLYSDPILCASIAPSCELRRRIFRFDIGRVLFREQGNWPVVTFMLTLKGVFFAAENGIIQFRSVHRRPRRMIIWSVCVSRCFVYFTWGPWY